MNIVYKPNEEKIYYEDEIKAIVMKLVGKEDIMSLQLANLFLTGQTQKLEEYREKGFLEIKIFMGKYGHLFKKEEL